MDNLNTITAYEQMRDMKAMHEKQLDELRDKNKELEAENKAVHKRMALALSHNINQAVEIADLEAVVKSVEELLYTPYGLRAKVVIGCRDLAKALGFEAALPKKKEGGSKAR